jgi:ubiquinone/menaquinone biosynthesis C-methylase UbiE
MFICPKCKSAILNNRCTSCNFVLTFRNGIPVFFSDTDVSSRYEEIASFYDNLYNSIEDTWNKVASRGPEFTSFISDIIIKNSPARYLDIGCGEGQLLAVVDVKEKYGMDISQKALAVAASKTHSINIIGCAEEMPFPDNFFDTLSSIGVMTHFVDDVKATKEINRILKFDGLYILGIYIKPSRLLSYYSKLIKILGQVSKPRVLFGLVNEKLKKIIVKEKKSSISTKQPIEKIYSTKELLTIFQKCGFTIVKEITKLNKPAAPLPGYHFRVYILKK